MSGLGGAAPVPATETQVLPANVYYYPSLAAYVANSHSRHNPMPAPTFDSTNRAGLPSSNPPSTGTRSLLEME